MKDPSCFGFVFGFVAAMVAREVRGRFSMGAVDVEFGHATAALRFRRALYSRPPNNAHHAMIRESTRPIVRRKI